MTAFALPAGFVDPAPSQGPWIDANLDPKPEAYVALLLPSGRVTGGQWINGAWWMPYDKETPIAWRGGEKLSYGV